MRFSDVFLPVPFLAPSFDPHRAGRSPISESPGMGNLGNRPKADRKTGRRKGATSKNVKNRQKVLGWHVCRLGSDFSRNFIFGPPDFFRGFCRRIFSPHFCGKKCPEKSSRKIPGKILQNLYNKNPRRISAEGPGQLAQNIVLSYDFLTKNGPKISPKCLSLYFVGPKKPANFPQNFPPQIKKDHQRASVKERREKKVSKIFSTSFDNFRAGQNRQKMSKIILDTFRAAPIFWPLSSALTTQRTQPCQKYYA